MTAKEYIHQQIQFHEAQTHLRDAEYIDDAIVGVEICLDTIGLDDARPPFIFLSCIKYDRENIKDDRSWVDEEIRRIQRRTENSKLYGFNDGFIILHIAYTVGEAFYQLRQMISEISTLIDNASFEGIPTDWFIEVYTVAPPS